MTTTPQTTNKEGFDTNQALLLAQYNFAEAANQPKETWVGNTFAALNRIKAGKFGDDLPSVVRGMSSAIQNNSKQWQIASDQVPKNEYEQKVFKKIYQTVTSVLGAEVTTCSSGMNAS